MTDHATAGRAAVLGGAEVAGDVGGQQLAGLAGVPGDEDEKVEGLGIGKRRRGIIKFDMEGVERAELEAVGRVVGAAAIAVVAAPVFAGRPLADTEQLVADMC